MEVRVLGCGDAFGTGGRFHSCFRVTTREACFLVDCGASALIAMRRFGVDPNGVGTIFLSHLHGDHFAGLPFLILDARYVSGRQAPLTIAGPPGTAARLAALTEAMYPGQGGGAPAFALEIVELAPDAPAVVNGIAVTTFTVSHPSGAPSFALRLGSGGRVLGYTGDTEWVDALVEVGRDADLLIAEASTAAPQGIFHLDIATLRRRLPEIGARRVLITHLGPDAIGHVPDGWEAAEDGLVVAVA